jgi:L-alanine-DL-glutamate epimerase-like enolase superfamily enzyme
MGMGIETDAEVLVSLGRQSLGESQVKWALDFNAVYATDKFCDLVDLLARRNFQFEDVIFWEQPTSKGNGISGLIDALNRLKQRTSANVDVVADEVFLSAADALTCTQHGISLNFKVQRLGGIWVAKEIEAAIEAHHNKASSLVGGTFPTAIGRVYDQQCAAVLQSADKPGDGWEPSTDWFQNEKHLIQESFQFNDLTQTFVPFRGVGLGITVDWDKIAPFVVSDPRNEYRKIRQGISGSKITIELRSGQSYQAEYERLTGRVWNWNL